MRRKDCAFETAALRAKKRGFRRAHYAARRSGRFFTEIFGRSQPGPARADPTL
jgi:hypothetical protein